jgi:lysine decarboxylase
LPLPQLLPLPLPRLLPLPAMAAGADMAAVSMHKTGGSLTQSSFLLCGKNVRSAYVRQIINLSQTTSASYLLMASLDIARRNLSLSGGAYAGRALRLAEYARAEINKLGGYRAFSRELANGGDVFDFDATKLSVHTRDIGLAGIEVYDRLRDEYGIQIEFGDLGNFLAIVSAGDRELEIERLVSALSEIKRLHARDKTGMFDHEYIPPIVEMPPQQAFYSESSSVPIGAGAGRVSAEFVMCYPPGIPILAPGERLTGEIIQYIRYAKEKGCFLTGTRDMELNNIQVIA